LSTTLQISTSYPFNLDGSLCPLLNSGETLLAFYDGADARQSIKQFCKRSTWSGKPAVSYAIDGEKMKELLASLFNSPSARQQLQSSPGRCPFLHDVIWQTASIENSQLIERVSGCTKETDGRLFAKTDLFANLLAEIQKEHQNSEYLTQLAYIVLAFAILQPDDRHVLWEAFLSAFPEYTDKFCQSAT
jgi:hypothetical protein